jgi:hypothetical protein
MNGYKTYVGIAIAAAPTIAHLFGYQVLPAFGEQLPEIVDSIVQLIGLSIALYGRLVATVPGWLARR